MLQRCSGRARPASQPQERRAAQPSRLTGSSPLVSTQTTAAEARLEAWTSPSSVTAAEPGLAAIPIGIHDGSGGSRSTVGGRPSQARSRRETLLGRPHECAALDRLLAAARAGRSSALVLRGEAGIGKTALLEYAIRSASDLRVVRAVGMESERELPFAALHQLCAPMLDRLDRLPDLNVMRWRSPLG